MRRTRTLLATTSALVVALAAQAHAAPPAANDRSIPFGDGTAWLAVRGRTPQQIAAALKLSNLRPATWKDGLAAANAGGSRAVFLTPDVHGWTLVVSAGFLSRVEAVPPDFHAFTNALSARLKTEVQFFAYEDRTEETLCAWARAIGEATVRAFSCFRTRARAVDVGVPDVDDMDVAIVRGEYVGTPDVTGIAGHWSIDPSTIHPGAPADRRIPTAVPRGYLAELPKDQPRKVAAPRFAPPDWVREAAARIDRPAAALDASCTRGEVVACTDLAVLLLASPQATRALPRAAALAGRACEGGSVPACALHGWMMRRGLGVAEDRAAARELLERACDGGHAAGCFLLGVALQRGEGATPQQSGAWDAYERACAGGYGPACARTGGTPGAGLAPRPACKGERDTSAAVDPTSFPDLVERVREHRRLAPGDVQRLPRWQARLLRNAVFAARGRTFEARDLRAFFAGYDWYRAAGEEVDGLLSPDDRRNVALVHEAEACAGGTIADDAGGDDGDWQLVRLLFLAEPDPPLSELASSVVGTWEPCAGPPAEGWPAYVFHPSGLVVHGWAGAPEGRIGRWRVEGSSLRVRWFASMKLVGAGFSPAEPGDENDEAPSEGVPKLFAAEGVHDFGDELFGREVDDDPTFDGSKLCKKSH